MNRTILITGALGYVGGRIAQSLAENPDYSLILLDKENISKPDWIKAGKLVGFDLLSDKSLDLICKGVDVIIHLAALNEIDSVSNPEQALLTNGLATLKLLKAAEQAQVKRFIFFSTAHIYKSPLTGIITEETVARPVHPYAITHKVAEDFVISAHDNKKLTGIVLRLSNSFGFPTHPNINRWTLIVNDLCRQAVTTKKLVLKSSGLQKRDFVTLSDVCRAVSHFLNLPVSQCGDGIFNLGGENSLRILDLAELIAGRCNKVFGFLPTVIHPEPQADEVSYELDFKIDKLKATGFSLQGNMNDEIDGTLRLCQKYFVEKK